MYIHVYIHMCAYTHIHVYKYVFAHIYTRTHAQTQTHSIQISKLLWATSHFPSCSPRLNFSTEKKCQLHIKFTQQYSHRKFSPRLSPKVIYIESNDCTQQYSHWIVNLVGRTECHWTFSPTQQSNSRSLLQKSPVKETIFWMPTDKDWMSDTDWTSLVLALEVIGLNVQWLYCWVQSLDSSWHAVVVKTECLIRQYSHRKRLNVW